MSVEATVAPVPAEVASADRTPPPAAPQSRGAGRRHHGIAHCRAPGECRFAGGAAGYPGQGGTAQRHCGAGAGGPQEEQARGILTTPRTQPASLSGISMTIWRLLADCDWVIEAVTENLAIKQALLEKVVPHLKRDAILTTNTSGLPVASIAAGPARGGPAALVRDPLLQSAALYAAGGNHSDARSRSGRDGRRLALRRRAAGQGSGVRARYSQLHRQPHRRLHHAGGGATDAGGRSHHRRGGRAHRHGHRLAADGHVPAGRHGGNRRAGARGRQLRGLRRGPAVPRDHAGAALAGRQDQTGLLPQGEGRRGQRDSASCWIGRRWNMFRRPGPKSLRSKWRRMPSTCPSGSANCWQATSARTKPHASTGGC